MDKWVMNLIEQAGYFGVFILMVLENVFPPIPSEVVLPLAGYMISKGTFQALPLGIAATAGSVVGTSFWYWLAVKLGSDRLKSLAETKGRWLAVTPDEVDKALNWFQRHGYASIFFGRCLPAVRTLISIPAGLTRMPILKFALLTSLGTALWSALLIWIGFTLGDRYETAGEWIGKIGNVIVLLAVGLYIYGVVRGNKGSTAHKKV